MSKPIWVITHLERCFPLAIILAVTLFSAFSLTPAQCQSTITVTIDTYPRITRITVDGTIYLPSKLPVTLQWLFGTTHQIKVPEISMERADTRYVFEGWNDGQSDTTRTILANETLNLIAFYNTQYYLNIISDYGSIAGGGWINSGQRATFKVEPTTVYASGNLTRYVFLGWSSGETSWRSENTLLITGATTIQTRWKVQHRLELVSTVSGTTLKGSGWYDEGSTVPILAETPYEKPKTERYVFKEWVSSGGEIATIANVNAHLTQVTINKPLVIQARWEKQYYLKVESPYGAPVGSNYYDADSFATASIEQIVQLSQDERLVFTKWAGDATLEYPSLKIRMDGPKRIEAQWKKQYRLEVVSSVGSPTGTGWYDAGEVASFDVQERVSAGLGRELVFVRWQGDYTGAFCEADIVMDGPKKVQAIWRVDIMVQFVLLVSLVVTSSGYILFKLTQRLRGGKTNEGGDIRLAKTT